MIEVFHNDYVIVIRCSQDELRSRNRELEDVDQALKRRQWELQQRAAQVYEKFN